MANSIRRYFCFHFPVAAFLIALGLGCSDGPSAKPAGQQPATSPKLGQKIPFDILDQKKLTNPPNFVEVAKDLGVNFKYFNDAREKRYFFPEILGGGFACLDYDLDGWPDIYCSNGCSLPLSREEVEHFDCLLRNRNGSQLVDVTELAAVRESGF
ncbi:MAG: hypothetical protein Q8M16_24005, partial [Pirellulaceae bacterium]|nr:hypothetical protein [Pirellulaceae bacterium]